MEVKQSRLCLTKTLQSDRCQRTTLKRNKRGLVIVSQLPLFWLFISNGSSKLSASIVIVRIAVLCTSAHVMHVDNVDGPATNSDKRIIIRTEKQQQIMELLAHLAYF